MTDFVITGGLSSSYPREHYGAHFTGTRATFCLPGDFAALDANVLAIPNFPISVLSATPVTASAEFFGMHIQKRANDAVSGLTFKTVRSHDAGLRWNEIETSAGVYNWALLDAWVYMHWIAGRDIVFVLFGTPVFYSARSTEIGAYQAGSPGIQAEPKDADMDKWDAFCTKVATRYAGRIKYYEIWNEPNIGNNGTTLPSPTTSCFFTGTWAKLAELTRRANQAIKAVDPTAKIICPAVQGWATTSGLSDTYFTGMLAASDGVSGTMKDWVDIIGVHLYLPSPNKTSDLAACIARVVASKASAGVSAMETWDTESGPISPYTNTYLDVPVQKIITRASIIKAAKGIAREIYYQYDHGTMGFVGRQAVIDEHERTRSLLMSGTMLSVAGFTDGRVAYWTTSGLRII